MLVNSTPEKLLSKSRSRYMHERLEGACAIYGERLDRMVNAVKGLH